MKHYLAAFATFLCAMLLYWYGGAAILDRSLENAMALLLAFFISACVLGISLLIELTRVPE